jgi:hypothetical protein
MVGERRVKADEEGRVNGLWRVFGARFEARGEGTALSGAGWTRPGRQAPRV